MLWGQFPRSRERGPPLLAARLYPGVGIGHAPGLGDRATGARFPSACPSGRASGWAGTGSIPSPHRPAPSPPPLPSEPRLNENTETWFVSPFPRAECAARRAEGAWREHGAPTRSSELLGGPVVAASETPSRRRAPRAAGAAWDPWTQLPQGIRAAWEPVPHAHPPSWVSSPGFHYL